MNGKQLLLLFKCWPLMISQQASFFNASVIHATSCAIIVTLISPILIHNHNRRLYSYIISVIIYHNYIYYI